MKIRVPSSWNRPRFQFGQPVTTPEGDGEIIGLQYIRRTSLQCRFVVPGWRYLIEIPGDRDLVILGESEMED